MNSVYPQEWFHNVKRFTVTDEVDPKSGKASTVIKIYYNGWWSFSRKVRFVEDSIVLDSVESYERHPEAQALVERLKESTKCFSSQVLLRR